ncbi:MAG TPA: hypothetical protein DCZ11_00290 [Gammaproteobacteria bacterium]|nr:hypothetical protein [Gammaproteobacteria bacterium]MCH76865.1 hypothetical protein [Gammaproteobacteria bacterium]
MGVSEEVLRFPRGGRGSTSEGSGFAPPYSLPAAGECVAIGTNTYRSVKPEGYSLTDDDWDVMLYGNWGTGVLVPNASVGGLYVQGTAGVGHNDGACWGAACFDFTVGTWHLKTPTQSTSPYAEFARGISSNFLLSETSGTPYVDVGGALPSCSHEYRNKVAYGSNVLIVCRGAATRDGSSTASAAVHLASLASTTVTYSRFTSNTCPFATADMMVVPDASRNRVWVGQVALNSLTTLHYFDLSDSTFKTAGSFSFPPSDCSENGFAFLHANRYIIKRGVDANLYAMDLEDISSGWQGPLTTSGTFPSSVVNSPARYSNGNYYWAPPGGGTSITRLVPPGSPIAGTWAFDSITLTGTAIPAYAHTNDDYTASGYNAAIDCCYTFRGGTHGVMLWRPGS